MSNSNFPPIQTDPDQFIEKEEFQPFFSQDDVTYTGSNLINDFQDLLDKSESFDNNEIVLKELQSYIFSTFVDIGTRKLVLNGAQLKASVFGGSGLSGTGSVLIESTDYPVNIGEGFSLIGDPSGNTAIFDLQTQQGRDFLVLKCLVEHNNSRSTISGFRDMTIEGFSISSSSSSIDIDPYQSRSVEFVSAKIGDDVTSPTAFDFVNEIQSGGIIDISLCTSRMPNGKVAFNIPNSSLQAAGIVLSANKMAGQGELLSGASTTDNNVYSKQNIGLENSILTAKTGYNDISAHEFASTQNQWGFIEGPYVFNSSVSLGVVAGGVPTNNGYLAISKTVQNERIQISCYISVDVSGGGQRVCGLRISKSSDGINWSPLDDGVVFTTRATAMAVSYGTVDIASQGDVYRAEIVNFESSNDFKVYSVMLSIF